MHHAPLVASLVASLAVCQDPAFWQQDLVAAKVRARAENKDVLVAFTGSDWCRWSAQLEADVLSSEAFRAWVNERFVPVKVDWLHDTSGEAPSSCNARRELSEQYRIQAFPTILLLDVEGGVYAVAGYQQGGAGKYVELLGLLHERGRSFKLALQRARVAQDEARARALDDGLSAIQPDIVSTYHFAIMREICVLDGSGSAGLKARYEARVQGEEWRRDAQQAAADLNALLSGEAGGGDEVMARLETVITAPKTLMHHQLALFTKAIVVHEASQDPAATAALLEAALVLAPDSPVGSQIQHVLPRFRRGQ